MTFEAFGFKIDIVMFVIALMFLLLGFNYYTKYLSDDSTEHRGKEVLGYSKMHEVCIEQGGVTSCIELENVVYKVLIETNTQTGLTNLIITKK